VPKTDPAEIPVDPEQQQQIRIAWAYFVEGLTQAEIAERLGLTRLRVNRILQICREAGVIQIRIQSPLASCVALERALIRRYGLRDAVVVPTPRDEDKIRAAIGVALGGYVENAVHDGMLVGIGWGAQSILGVTRIDSASATIPAYADEAGDAYRTVLYRHLVDPAEPKGGLKPEDLAKAPISLPDLPQGWSIRSIELVPWDGGSGFEATIDTDRFGLVTLFAAATDGFDVQQPQAQRAKDVTVAYWQVGPAVYALCAEAKADDLLAAANGLAGSLY